MIFILIRPLYDKAIEIDEESSLYSKTTSQVEPTSVIESGKFKIIYLSPP